MTEGKIPPELVEALSVERGFSLLIRGAPGTGKTMLALEMIHQFGDTNAVYLSTRVSPSSPRYPFTLEGGRFQYIEPFKRKRIEKPLRVKPLKNTETHISTGSEDMDKLLDGGFERGSFNVIEMGDDMSIWGYQSIVIHMLVNCIKQKNHCICLPCCGWDERHLRRQLLPFVSEED